MAQGEWKSTTQLIEAGLRILKKENPMTIRQLFYRLVSNGTVDNSMPDYHHVSAVMTKARLDSRCPYDWIVDRSRPTYTPYVFEDPGEYAESVKTGYRKDYWADQPCHVEIWTEKDAIIGSIEPVTDELGVTVRVARGHFSTTRIHDIAQEFVLHKRRGKNIHVLYLGDHDPSGIVIQSNGSERLEELLEKSLGEGPWYSIVRLAILKQDITKFRLPPLRIKSSDPNAEKFRRKFGTAGVELDALPPEELRRRLREAIESRIDKSKWDRAIAVEKVELRSITENLALWGF